MAKRGAAFTIMVLDHLPMDEAEVYRFRLLANPGLGKRPSSIRFSRQRSKTTQTTGVVMLSRWTRPLRSRSQRQSSRRSSSRVAFMETISFQTCRLTSGPVRLTVIDTPGFGDYVNNRDSWMPIIEFLDDQHESYMLQEQQPRRADKIDLRVHACLYFIRPTGHTLKPLDIEVMKRLSSRVNLIPVVAKADTLSPADLARFKQRVGACKIIPKIIALTEQDPCSCRSPRYQNLPTTRRRRR